MNNKINLYLSVPILILGFNNESNIRRIIECESIEKVKNIYISIDGPRKNNNHDMRENIKIRKLLEEYNVKKAIQYRILKYNLGIRKAIPDAINWVLAKHESLIVIEDDVLPTENFINFVNLGLKKYEKEFKVGSIAGYNNILVSNDLNNQSISSRLSIYPESYAWGTWKDRWMLYSDYAVDEITIKQIHEFTKDILITTAWKINFLMAKFNIIDTWAYRWAASLWINGKLTVVPNENLVTYLGTENRTHTFQKQKWTELPIREHLITKIEFLDTYSEDIDKYVGHKFHNGSLLGIIKLFATPIYKLFLDLKRIKFI